MMKGLLDIQAVSVMYHDRKVGTLSMEPIQIVCLNMIGSGYPVVSPFLL